MNYIPIHTNVYPSYNYLTAENAFLKQDIEYKHGVICDQQGTIEALKNDISQLSQANMELKKEHEKASRDAEKWRVMKNIIKTQGTDEALSIVEKVVAQDIDNERKRKK